MDNQFNMIQELLIKKAELNAKLALLPYDGTPEVKEISGKKYLYVRKRELGKLKSEYVDIYSEELHNLLLRNAKEAKSLRKEIRRIERELASFGYSNDELEPNVLLNLDFARKNMSGIIEIGSDYMGTVTLWDEDYSRSNPMVDAAVSLNSAGTGEHGTMMSEGGWFTDIRLEHADWIVDPGLSEFDAMICIDGWYENGDDEYRYEIYLRPWGTYWDDVAEEGRPYLYDDWYIPLIEKNALMPDVIGGEATEFAGGGSQGGGEATQTGATGGDYGKSNANATGQVSREVMDRAILSLKGDFIWDDVKYEDIRELLGTDGVPYTEFDSWRADRHTYEWFAPERVTLLVAFKVENGEEISNSWTSGSWDGPEYDVTPVKLGSRPEGSGNMIDQSVTITDSRQNVEATVMFKIPEGAWCVDPGVRSSFEIINNPTTDNVPFRTPYIKVELFETSESLNYYEKDFENLTELESRTIGGVTMNGRSYKNVGIEWIEFYGQIPSGGWISIRLAYMSADPGSDCSNILDSMSFK